MRYTVKQVSALTGVSPELLRAWERRYGVVTPVRSDAGYRLYDDADLDRLRLMVRLVEEGAPASLAAQQVSSPDVGGTDGALPPPDALVAVAQHFDGGEADRLLDRAFAAGSFEVVTEAWLMPALVELGEAWADGRVEVSGEHFVSGVVRRRLGRAFDAAGTAIAGPVVLVGLPPGAIHELSSLAFATCLRRAGVDVRWLGGDIPVDGWTHAVHRSSPQAVVLSVPLVEDTEAAQAVVRELVRVHPTLPVFCGGRGAGGVAGPCTLLPTGLAEAARDVATRLRRPGHEPRTVAD